MTITVLLWEIHIQRDDPLNDSYDRQRLRLNNQYRIFDLYFVGVKFL